MISTLRYSLLAFSLLATNALQAMHREHFYKEFHQPQTMPRLENAARRALSDKEKINTLSAHSRKNDNRPAWQQKPYSTADALRNYHSHLQGLIDPLYTKISDEEKPAQEQIAQLAKRLKLFNAQLQRVKTADTLNENDKVAFAEECACALKHEQKRQDRFKELLSTGLFKK